MTEYFTFEQTLMQVTRLTPDRLSAFIAAEAIRPTEAGLGPSPGPVTGPVSGPVSGPVFGPGDLARLELLCDMTELYDMTPEALAVLIAVIDQMHAARRDRYALLRAIRAETAEVQARIAAVLMGARASEGAGAKRA